jgi:hypothetical protein
MFCARVTHNQLTDQRYEWCGLENVETVILDCSVRTDNGTPDPLGDLCVGDTISDLTAFGGPRSGRQLGFATWLKTHPRLHSIYYIASIPDNDTLRVFNHLGSIVGGITPTIQIRSYRHGGEECFHITVIVQSVNPLCDSESDSDSYSDSRRPKPVDILYTAGYPAAVRGGPLVAHERTYYARSSDPVDADTAVPLDVLEKMREVEGASVEEWDKRGVEVGAEAWKLLMDSREVR